MTMNGSTGGVLQMALNDAVKTSWIKHNCLLDWEVQDNNGSWLIIEFNNKQDVCFNPDVEMQDQTELHFEMLWKSKKTLTNNHLYLNMLDTSAHSGY